MKNKNKKFLNILFIASICSIIVNIVRFIWACYTDVVKGEFALDLYGSSMLCLAISVIIAIILYEKL